MRWLIAIGLVGLTWAVFAQTLRHDFVNYDDPSYVYENPRIIAGLSLENVGWAFTHIHGQNWHPLTTISHMADSQWFGRNASGHHLTNVLLHSLTAALLFAALYRLTRATWRSAIVAALFAVHPLRVESVAWIAERKDVLSGLFFMLTLLAYAAYARRPGPWRYLTVCGCVAAGLMSKPMLVTLPAVLLLLDYWPMGRLSAKKITYTRCLLEKVPLILLVIGGGIATLLAQGSYIGAGENLPLTWRVGNALVTYLIYLKQFFWPTGLIPFYPHPEHTLSFAQIALSATLLVTFSLAGLWQAKKRPYLLVGWLWYVGMLVPVIGLVQVGWQGHADRYTYLPEIGIGVVLVWGFAEMIGQGRKVRLLAGIAAVVTIAAISVVASRQTTHWKNSEALWRHTLEVTPDNDVAQTNLGVVLLGRGETGEAASHFETALRLRPDNVSAHINLGNVQLHDGRLEEGQRHLLRALALEPANSEGSNLLGVCLLQRGDVAGALQAWGRTLEFDPLNGNACSNLAWVFATNPNDVTRDGVKAEKFARQAMQVAGGRNALVLRTLAAALAEAGKFDEAIAAASQALAQARAEGNGGLVEELEATLVLYRAGKPLRDPAQGQPLPAN